MNTDVVIKSKCGEKTGTPLFQVEGDLIWHTSPEEAVAYFNKYVLPKILKSEILEEY